MSTTYSAPRPPKGEHEITVFPDWSNDEPVVCHYEHIKAGRMTSDFPGSPEEYNLISAYIRGWDCYRVLSREQIDEVEQLIKERA